ncbi:MAG: V-type ATPase subunit [Bacilli bacterium]
MNYPYAVGSIKVIEANILDKNKLSKLINIDKDDFIKALNDIGYGNNEAKTLEEVFAYQTNKVKSLLEEITPDKFHTDLFFFEYDCLTIKALFKKKIFGVNIDLSAKTTLINYVDLERMIIEEDYTSVNKNVAKFIKSINEELTNASSSRVVSAKIDNLFYSYVLKSNSNATLKQYFKLRIDLANLSTLIRSTNLNWDLSRFSEMFIEGGLISKDVFVNNYNLQNKEYGFRSFYNEKLSKIIKSYEDLKNINVFERQLDNFLLEFMSEFRNDSFDIGPIIYFFLKKDAEAKNIRYIYSFSDIQVSDLLDY